MRWLAPVRGYRTAARRELIPAEPNHPRADERYHRIDLGTLEPLPRPIPSRRLRRITFIPTTLARLLEADEINDLWIKSSAQERLWAALKQADIEAERQYPLREDLPQYVADFALLCRGRQGGRHRGRRAAQRRRVARDAAAGLSSDGRGMAAAAHHPRRDDVRSRRLRRPAGGVDGELGRVATVKITAENAERIVPSSASSAVNSRFATSILQELCMSHGLTVEG